MQRSCMRCNTHVEAVRPVARALRPQARPFPHPRRVAPAAAAHSDDPSPSPPYSAVTFSDFESAAKALQALEEYRLLMHSPEPDLLEGAVLIARHRYPTATLASATEILDDLAEQVTPRLPSSRYPLKMVNALSSFLYEELGFSGASGADYYLPDNSCINFVLNERQGIPITLALVYSEVAKRCDFPMWGVNVPGHFHLTPADPDLEFLVDPVTGKVAFPDDVASTLTGIFGRPVALRPGALTAHEALAPRLFFARMLNNLKAIYAARKDYAAALQMSQYLAATRPGDVDEVRERGFILYHLRRYNECAQALVEYLERAPADAADVDKVRRVLLRIRGANDGDDVGSTSGED